ncbi:ABC transporter ATP-binding protein [Pseudobdellovibrio sp. HCB154]|uniref:ABC transporter ATP-binding protein n=1 Tax=Pseudobdellovibrio sp. HCB154 TaxID=3386277 RepID=UPI003916D3DC
MKAFSRSIFDTLLQAYRPFLVRIILVVILGFVGRLIFLSNAQMIAKFYDNHQVITRDDLAGLTTTLLIVLVVAFVLTILYRTVFSRLSALAVSRIYDETTYRVSRYPLSYFDHTPVGKITTRFSSDYGNIFRLFGGPLAEFLSIIFDLMGISLLIMLTHPYFVINLALAGLGFYVILKRNQLRLRGHRREVSILRGPSVAHFSETVQGSLSIRQNSKVKTFISRFLKLDDLYIASKFNIIKSIMRFSTELNIISTLLFLANGLLGMYLVKEGKLGAGQVAVILGFTILATNTLQMFFEWYSQFEEALVGVERMDEFIRNPIEDGAFLPAHADFETHHPKKAKGKKADENSGVITAAEFKLSVENLSLTYPGQNHPTLSNVSFKLKPEEKLGIIGRTGAGKSTLIAALLRLYPFNQGVILIDNAYKNDIEDHRGQFSLISQDQFFIKGTIKDNLDLFNQYSNEQLTETLKLVGLPLQLHFMLDEKGQNLSQGEKQLLSLARGLLQNAEIFIFDEATANIDPQSEKLIELALKKTLAHKTQIRIAHRLQTVLDCDRILWLENGQVKMLGSTPEVLEAFEATR